MCGHINCVSLQTPFNSTLSLCLNTMNAEPFRHFLGLYNFSSGVELLLRSRRCEHTRGFVKWFIELREDSRTWRHLGDILQQLDVGEHGHKQAQWFTVLASEIYNLFLMLHRRWKPKAKRNNEPPKAITRETRRKMAKMGQCIYMVPALKDQANEQALSLWQQMSGTPHCIWFDNFYRKRFVPVPGDENRSLNCTAMAVQKLDSNPPFVPPLPSPDDLRAHCGPWSIRMSESHKDLITVVKDLTIDPIPLSAIRAPLDVTRRGVTHTQWQPFLLSDHVVGETPDLVHILKDIVNIQQHTGSFLPILIDENIHYQVLKLAYSES